MIEAERRPTSRRNKHEDFIGLMEDALNTPLEGSGSLYERKRLIMKAINNLQSRAEALEVELSEQGHTLVKDSIGAVLDALGYIPLDRLPTELQINIRFSLDRFGLDSSQIFPDQKRSF